MSRIILVIVFMITVSACGNSGSEKSAGSQDQSVSFQNFILTEINSTAEDTEPKEINALQFSFLESEDAFDSVL